LDRLLKRYLYIQSCKEKVQSEMLKNNRFLLFEQPIPWLESFFELGGENHPALFVIMPSDGQWKLRTIPPTSEDRMAMRKALPASWAGLQDEQLQKMTGLSGAIFCHKSRFISVWKTKKDALEALKVALL
jgi:uncharacterized UPF0160 family protein